MIAVVKTGGKQFVVREGDKIKIEKVDVEMGKPVEVEVLMVAEEDGSDVKVGAPVVKGAKVVTKLLAQGRAKKIIVGKFKNKSRYRRSAGHRQPFTQILIEKISA